MEALKGIRIIEFSQAFAGPYATSLLGYLGAEVIKVESLNWPDLGRYIEFNSSKPKIPEPEKSAVYNTLNLNKKCIRLNIKNPESLEIARKLIKECDVVLENMRPGVMAKKGLGYEAIEEIKPDIIYISSCACGQTGPWTEFAGYAPNFAALSGISGLTGYPDDMPTEFMGSVDIKSAYAAAAAIMTALIYRNRTSRGQFIDLSSTEAIAACCGDQLLKAVLTSEMPRRNGNRDDQFAPHDAYKCLGEDRWVSIAIFDETEWSRFCQIMEVPGLIEDPRFHTREARLRNIDDLDLIISEWTKDKTPEEVSCLLQANQLAASPSMNGADLFEDDHLRARGVFVENEHPVIGKEWITAPPWKLSETPAQIKRHAPLFGEHSEEVFQEILGLSSAEIKQLEEAQVIF